MNSHYGQFGGQYIPESLMGVLLELEQAYLEAKDDPAFQSELNDLLTNYVGRESPLYFAGRLTEHCKGARIYLKREDLNHTGAHKVNNTIGQALLAKRMGKRKLIAETGAGMHGVATATVAALLGMQCDVFMGAVDVARQAPNVERMRVLGARVVAVESGSATLKDAMNEAIRYWAEHCEDTFTASAPLPVRTPIRQWSGIFSRLSAGKRAGNVWNAPADCPMKLLPASAAAAMLWGFLPGLSMTVQSNSPVWRPAAAV